VSELAHRTFGLRERALPDGRDVHRLGEAQERRVARGSIWERAREVFAHRETTKPATAFYIDSSPRRFLYPILFGYCVAGLLRALSAQAQEKAE